MADSPTSAVAAPTDEDLQRERERAEATRDEPLSSAATRPGAQRGKVLSVRLNPDEFEELSRYAAALEVTVSSLVRGWVLDQLRTAAESPASTVERIARELDQLRRQLVA